MIEKLSSDICNEHVAKVMEVLVSLARVAPAVPQHASPHIGICAQKCCLMTPQRFTCETLGEISSKYVHQPVMC